MSVVTRIKVIVLAISLGACGGSGSGGGDNKGGNTQSSSSSQSVMSSSSSSLAIPADFPKGTTETLPTLSLTTDGAAPIVSKENYLTGQFTLNGEGVEQSSGTLEIRGRGNSTWSWPKNRVD